MVTESDHASAKTIRKERYEAALGIADASTSDAHDRPGVPAHALRRKLLDHAAFRRTDEERQGSPGSPPKDPATVAHRTVQAAIQHDDLFRYRDRDGEWRYTVASEGKLKAIIAYENAQESPDVELIERVVAALNGGES